MLLPERRFQSGYQSIHGQMSMNTHAHAKTLYILQADTSVSGVRHTFYFSLLYQNSGIQLLCLLLNITLFPGLAVYFDQMMTTFTELPLIMKIMWFSYSSPVNTQETLKKMPGVIVLGRGLSGNKRNWQQKQSKMLQFLPEISFFVSNDFLVHWWPHELQWQFWSVPTLRRLAQVCAQLFFVAPPDVSSLGFLLSASFLLTACCHPAPLTGIKTKQKVAKWKSALGIVRILVLSVPDVLRELETPRLVGEEVYQPAQ